MKTAMNFYLVRRSFYATAALLFTGLMLTACADEDLANNKSNQGEKGATVSFNVSEVQDETSTQPAQAITRAAFAQQLAPQGLAPEDLVHQKLAIQSSNGMEGCLIESTVPGVSTMKPNNNATRANITTRTTLGNFSTIGYRGTAETNIATPWFYNKETNADGTLIDEIRWEWPQPYGKFYAIYPLVTTEYSKIKLSSESHAGIPYVNFEVEPNVTNQKDLMTACSGMVHYAIHGTAPQSHLRFRHALTAVRFKVGQNLSWDKVIDKIEIRNAKSKGRYTLPADANGTGAQWTDLDAPTTFTLSDVNVSTSEYVNSIIVGKENDNYTFYMLPQPLAGVSVYIHFTDGTEITSNLKGRWKAGTTKTYALSQNTSNWEYHLTVRNPSLTPHDATYSNFYQITSYRTTPSTSVQYKVPWKVVGYDNDGDDNFSMDEKPEWITSLTMTEGEGSTTGQVGHAWLTKNIRDYLAEYNKVMQDATPLGTADNPYDLSTKGESIARSTANCYLISAPGYYKIPLVYGNAIQNGTNNPSSYQTLNTGIHILSNFKDHAGANITDPWITQTNSGANIPNGAKIVWADQSGLVEESSLTLSADRQFVQFHIPQDKIKNGNAVIAVTKDGTVVWSWHLWFDHADALNIIPCTNAQGVVYNFTKQPLGFAYRKWNKSLYNTPRKARVKVEQTVANGGIKKFAYISIEQKPDSARLQTTTLYQSGRKEPLPGTKDIAHGKITTEGDITPQKAIRHPEAFFVWNKGMAWAKNPPAGHAYYNLWSMNSTGSGLSNTPVVKTIYDPCPAGFKIPDDYAFTGFSKGSQYAMNVSGKWDDGWHFNNKLTNPDGTIYFPAAGFLTSEHGGILNTISRNGCYWTGGLYDKKTRYYLNTHPAFVHPQSAHYRANGYAIRPVAE